MAITCRAIAAEPGLPNTGNVAEAAPQPEEIIVTASKRAERIKDVPFAISVVDAKNLVEKGEFKLADYSALVPGLQINDQSSTAAQSSIIIRGLSGSGIGNPTTALYLDDIPLNASTVLASGTSVPDLDPGDLSRIEVLKGPQGTLYGATSLGGLVKFITRQPNFDEFSASTEVGTVNVDHGDWGYDFRGRVNVPFSTDAALSVSGFDRQTPGYIDDPEHNLKNVNDVQNYGGRAALSLTPTDSLLVDLSAVYQNQKADGSNSVFLGLANNNPTVGKYNQATIPSAGDSESESTILAATVTYDLDVATLTSTSSYIIRRFDDLTDLSDYFGQALFDILGFPNGAPLFHHEVNNDKLTEEIRLNSPENSGFLDWQAGVFYTKEWSDLLILEQTVDKNTGAGIPGAPTLVRIDVPSQYKEVAGFGTLTAHITSAFDVEVGLRESHDDQYTSQDSLTLGSESISTARTSQDEFTYSVNARYKLSEEQMVYARIATGFRPGGPNAGITSGGLASYQPDSVTSYELGTKGGLFNDTVVFDLAAFYVDWNAIQLQGNSRTTGIAFYFNGGQARDEGAELSVTYEPVEGLTLDGNVAYADSVLITAPIYPGTYAPGGSQLPYAPKWAYHLGADYKFKLSNEWTSDTGIAYRFVSAQPSFYETSAAIPRYKLPSYDMVDLTIGATHNSLGINFFIRNLFNEFGITGAAQAFQTVRQATILQPRTIGVSITEKF